MKAALKIKERKVPVSRHGDHGGGGFYPPLGEITEALVCLDFINGSATRYKIKRDFGLFPMAVKTGEWSISGQPTDSGIEHLRMTGTIFKSKRSSK